MDERPNPMMHKAEASSLPRSARARVPDSSHMDPVPQNKKLDAGPVLHGELVPAGHDVDRARPKKAEELGINQKELEKLQKSDREHVPLRNSLQSGMDWQGSATQANKKMPSTHRTADSQGQLSKGGGK